MKMTRYRPILMQSDRWIEEVDFRSQTKSGFLFQLKKKKFSMQTFSIEQSDPRIPSKLPVEKLDLEKLDFFDGMRGLNCSIEKVGIEKALFRLRKNARFGLRSEIALFDPPIRLHKNWS